MKTLAELFKSKDKDGGKQVKTFQAKPKDDRSFQDAHTVVNHKDLVVTGKDDAMYQATNVKIFKRKENRMGNDDGDDEAAYDFGRSKGVNDQGTGLKPMAIVAAPARFEDFDEFIDGLADELELDEVSKGKLRKYLGKASGDYDKRYAGGEDLDSRKMKNRERGLFRSGRKLGTTGKAARVPASEGINEVAPPGQAVAPNKPTSGVSSFWKEAKPGKDHERMVKTGDKEKLSVSNPDKPLALPHNITAEQAEELLDIFAAEMGIDEKYLGFKKLKGKLAHEKGVRNPGALAASIGRHKYGSKGFSTHKHGG